MARHASFWSNFFRATRASYKAQHAGRTIRAIASGNPTRVRKLIERRLLYKGFARLVNRLLK
jgi:hypothetical protein